jgi:cytidine deaminase
MDPLSAQERGQLLHSARDAAQHSYSPYSRFRVGAAILTETGETILGTNVENGSYGLTLCAERAALASLIARSGRVEIRAVAVACVDAREARPAELMPCGACRQWLMELAPDAEVLIDGLDRVFTVPELLPHGFTLDRRGA